MYKQLINKYNNRVHRTIKMSPCNVNSSNEPNSVRGITLLLVNINMSLRNGIHQTIQINCL